MNSFRPYSIIVALATVSSIAFGQQGSGGASDCAKATSDTLNHATMDHVAHAAALSACATAPVPASAGQAAFAAISEIVRMLEADPNTDWSRVNIEALRQHLIDMDEVIMHAVVAQRNVPGGIEIDVTGGGRTAAAIRRMAVNHARMLDQGTEYRAAAREIPNGARITVTAKSDSPDPKVVAKIRGLGFSGMMTEGNHHAAHHLALARGDAAPHGR